MLDTRFDIRIQIVAIVGAMALVFSVVELVRRRKLTESYSIAWLALCIIIVVFALFRDLQEMLAALIGVYYPPALILGTLIFLLLGIVLYLCTVLTHVEAQTRRLAQRIALLEERTSESVERLQNDKSPETGS